MPQVLQQSLVLCSAPKSSVSSSYFRQASDNFGPALNSHLSVILKLVKLKESLATTEQMAHFRETLIENGGGEAMRIIMEMGDLKH